MNKPGYSDHENIGSVRDLFHDNSLGAFELQNLVTPWERTQESIAYYDDAKVDYGERARDLVAEGALR